MRAYGTPLRHGRLLGAAAAAVVAALMVSCGDSTGPSQLGPAAVVPSTPVLAFGSLGDTASVSAIVVDANGAPVPGVTPSWSSAADSVAIVSAAGLVTAVGNGVAVLTASAGSVSADVTVTVAQVADSISIVPDRVSFSSLGDTLRLTAEVRDAGGSVVTGAPVTWVALDTMVARVSADGLATAVGEGSSGVAAISGAAFATGSIDVAQVPSALSLSADSLTFVSLGDTASLAAVVTDGLGSAVPGAAVAWTSTDGSVATVSPQGRVTALSNGVADVVATSGAAADTVRVTVGQVADSVVVSPALVVLKDPGDTTRLSLSAFDAGGAPIPGVVATWTSADTTVASVDPGGLVTAVATGSVAIGAQVDGASGQATARVEPELTLVASGPTALAGEVLSQLALAVRVEDLMGTGYAGAPVDWSVLSGGGSIASGSPSTSGPTGHAAAVWTLGAVAGAQQAAASIESRGATVQVVFTATASAAPAVVAALVADSIIMHGVGETAFLGPTFLDPYGNVAADPGLTWTSRDTGVVGVAADGLVTATGAGATYVVGSLAAPQDSLLVTVRLDGAITVTFDDGWLTVFQNAWPSMLAGGIQANVAVNPAQVGFPAYLGVAELDQMHAAGWSIVSHSMTHDSLPSLSPGELDYELRASQEWIAAQGYEGGNVFVVPYHEWGSRERSAIAGYYEAARGTSANSVVPDSIVSWRPDDPYDLTGLEADDLPYTTVAGRDLLRDLLQRTVDEGAFVDVFFHDVPVASVADFQATLAVIDQFRDRVLPYHRLYPRLARSVF